MNNAHMTPVEVMAKIGNVFDFEIIDGVLYTLSEDQIVRVNDADTGCLVSRIECVSQDDAFAFFDRTIKLARALADRG